MSERTEPEIRAKIKELSGQAIVPPKDVQEDEKELWAWFCKGGISALRWILGEADGKPELRLE